MVHRESASEGPLRKFLTVLTRSKLSNLQAYGVVILSLGLISGFRLLVPLDKAPFLLYLPAVFLLSVAFGQRAGVLATMVSAVFAGCFFDHPGSELWQLTGPQWISIGEYLVVGGAMVRVCGALRRLLAENAAALERAQRSEREMRAILDTVPVGIMIAEAPSGRIVGRNRMLDQIIGAADMPSAAKPRPQTDYSEIHGVPCRWATHRAARISRSRGSRAAGPGRPIAAGALPPPRRHPHLDGPTGRRDPRCEQGNLKGAVLAMSDIDRRKRAEAAQLAMTDELRQRTAEAEAAREAAEAANRAKSAFLANMSHELRTPLSAVIGYTELLEEESEDGAILNDLGKIRSNAKHLLSLINDVLDLSKVEANKMELFAETIALGPFLEDVAATVDPLVKTKANSLTLDLGDDLGTMRTDAVKLRQCLFNLLGNACKFTENGRITLRVQRDGDWLSFSVEGHRHRHDAGAAAAAVPALRPGRREHDAQVRGHRPRAGADPRLRAPAGRRRERHQHRGPGHLLHAARAGRGPGGCRDAGRGAAYVIGSTAHEARDLVLVIDDEASQRELLTRFLTRQHFAVRAASDGRSGLELARSLKPRVILLDVMMPDLDGWAVLKALKADPVTVDIPVVIVSFVAEAKLGASLGAADSIVKPVDWAELKSLLDGFRASGGDVLVVDDDPELRARLRTALERNGWSVREAGDGSAALEEVARAAPHLVVLDLTMPVLDGFGFLHRLRETPEGANIPVVVLSARDVTAAERLRLVEAERVLRKGDISLGELTAELRALHGVGRQAETA